MNEVELKLKDKIKALVREENIDFHELSKSRIQHFGATLCRLLVNQNEHFDVIISGGNSGLYVSKIAEYAYEILGIQKPPILKLPIYRYIETDLPETEAPLFDNSLLLPMAQEQLKNVNKVQNILFVDDEIRIGTTARNCFELVLEAVYNSKYKNPCSCIIVAEHHFFEWHHDTPNLAVRFYAHSRLIPGVTNIISHFLPEPLLEEIKTVLGSDITYNHALALVVGGGLKTRDSGVPSFDPSKALLLVSKIENYESKKEQLLSELKDEVRTGIEKYKAGEIKFIF